MALIHKATLRPTKLELLTDWLPSRGWYDGPTGEIERVAAYRFDDPAGAVGLETMLIRVGDGPAYQVPLTYREAPLTGADEYLLGTADHSVLGKRWIYDGIGDPVYVAALAESILANTGQAEQFTQIDDRLEPRELDMSISSNVSDSTKPDPGAIQKVTDTDPAVIVTDTVELTLVRRLDTTPALPGAILSGSWPGGEGALASATLRR
ncbi:CG0192-related protein [Kribbella swartbergensis]